MSGRRNGTDEQMGNEKGRGAKWKGEGRKERRERGGKRGGRGAEREEGWMYHQCSKGADTPSPHSSWSLPQSHGTCQSLISCKSSH